VQANSERDGRPYKIGAPQPVAQGNRNPHQEHFSYAHPSETHYQLSILLALEFGPSLSSEYLKPAAFRRTALLPPITITENPKTIKIAGHGRNPSENAATQNQNAPANAKMFTPRASPHINWRWYRVRSTVRFSIEPDCINCAADSDLTTTDGVVGCGQLIK